MKKILISILACLIVAAAVLSWFVLRLPSSPFDGRVAAAPAPAELIAAGERVARQADCVACHSLPGKAPFSGGLEMGTPLGSIYATNITPDPEHGIGRYTLADFDRAVRHGVTPDRARLYPAMPYPSYVKMTDADIEALYAFFMNAVEPVAQPDPASGIEWPLNIRWPLALWNVVFTEAGTYVPDPAQSEEWNRGAYLVQAAGHCGSCHTPRSVTMNEKAYDQSSPVFLSGALLDGWYAPSLLQDHNTGLGRWSTEEITEFLKTGRNAHSVVFGSMAEVYNNSLQFLDDADIRAMAVYLKSLPGDAERDGAPWSYAESRVSQGSPAANASAGAHVYATRCSYCHGPGGEGQAPWISPLAGASSSLIGLPESQINVTLNGSWRVVTGGVPDSYRMPPFRAQLSDDEIADVLSFIRTTWGNSGGTVSSADVAAMRAHTDPASPNPIVLQMR